MSGPVGENCAMVLSRTYRSRLIPCSQANQRPSSRWPLPGESS